MKKYTKIILMISICLISVGIVFSTIGLLAGASPSQIFYNGLWNTRFLLGNGYGNDFEEDNTYHLSDQAVDSLDISWIGGKVSVVPYDGEDIVIREKSKGKIDEDTCLGYKIKGATLKIDYFRSKSVTAGTGAFVKQLEVKIPRHLAQNLEELNFDGVSSDLSIKDLDAASLDVTTISGNLSGKNIRAKNVNMDSTSGDMRVAFSDCPQALNMDSTSGDCILTLPKGSSVTAEFDSVSGDFSSSFRTRLQEYDIDNLYVIGNGENEFNMDTVSGDFIINKAAE